MYNAAVMMAQSTDELVYIIAVLVIIGVSWLSERIKSKMAEKEQGDAARPRPTRRHPTSLPRPQIPPVGGDVAERPRRTAPPLSRPQPPARPPGPPPVITREEPRRQPAPRPGFKGRPPRTREEAKTIIRGEQPLDRPAAPAREETLWELPRPGRPVPPRPQSPPPAVQPAEQETWARLTKPAEPIRPDAQSRQLGQLKPVQPSGAGSVSDRVGAQSFQQLTPADLQRAFVLKEILEPPLALRDV